MASKIPTRAPHGQIHSGVLAKNRLTHVLSSSFLTFGYPQLPRERATPAGWGTIAIERRWSRWIDVFLFRLEVLVCGPMGNRYRARARSTSVSIRFWGSIRQSFGTISMSAIGT